MVTPTLRAKVPAQRCVSMMIPNLIKLIMKIKYHKSQETKVKYLFHNITGRKHNSELLTGHFPLNINTHREKEEPRNIHTKPEVSIRRLK